ncbi:differentially expressed in FDCP 8 [Sarcoptes scabiei]|nr:differentially expressed in FDCP 8 [Sarcoptes scabiei]
MAPSKNMKENEVETIADLDKELWIRGKTPDDIDEKCFDLCQRYMMIYPRWKRFCNRVENLKIRRITGGLTNQLYLVCLKFNADDDEDHCEHVEDQVTIKFHLTKHLKVNMNKVDTFEDRINDFIVSLMVSERQIGPKIYGIDRNALIQAYYEHEQFRVKHQQNPILLRRLAQKLAEINLLEVPIEKDRFAILKIIENYIGENYVRLRLDQLRDELELSNLKSNNLIEELRWYGDLVRNRLQQSPTVFCHNDFRGNNILVVRQTEEIILCDFEYSSYGLRGLDLSSFLMEWNHNSFSRKVLENFPDDSVIENFVRLYLEEIENLDAGYSKQQENSIEFVMREVKIHFLTICLFFIAIIINQRDRIVDSIPYNPESQARTIDAMFGQFLQIKSKLIDQGLLDF